MHEVIITEKPSAAQKIAEALSDSKVEVKRHDGVNYYEVKHGGKLITIVPAVGHLFTVAEKKKSFKYPSFDLEWKAVYVDNKEGAYTKKYVDTIREVSKGAKSFVVACDYDIEGEVIGLNVIRFICGQKDAKRMKFSTLTKPDLIEAYENVSKTIDWGQAKAGETRHFLDWMYGINMSRALTLAIRKSKAYRTLSSGRVQGPSLNLLADREREIQAFKPVPFWQILLNCKAGRNEFEAWHEKDKLWDVKDADHIMTKIKGKDATVKDVKKTEQKHQPPYPFDLTTLQTESYACLGLTPSKTLEIAQELYSAGYISYPRTSSQQLSEKLGFRKILTQLSGQEKYSMHAKQLLAKKSLVPNNGKKTDPAHPAIYPTGLAPKPLAPQVHKVYDLVVKRFFSTFGDWATRETLTIELDVNKEIFVAKGTKTKEKGWYALYEPYSDLKEEQLPELNVQDKVQVKKATKLEKETQPPKRYTEASLIKELESRNLGTKATRAQIIENLYDREYIAGKSIAVSRLGMKTNDTLRKYCPEIIDEELTRSFEDDMDKIREKEKTPEQILAKAEKEISKTLVHFKENEDKIGKALAEAFMETENERSYIAKCTQCKDGELHILVNRKNRSRFVACNKYPDCKTTFPLPGTGEIKKTDASCEICKSPMIDIRKGRIVKRLCINPNCKSKMPDDKDLRKEEQEFQKDIVEEDCPKCKEGKLVVRKSVYGHFLACNRFPKCRYVQPIRAGPLKEDFKK